MSFLEGQYPSGGYSGRAFLYDASGMRDLGTLPGRADSEAYGINASGQVVGASYLARTHYILDDGAFLYDASGMHDLGTFGGTSSAAYSIIAAAYGINARGQVVGWAPTASGNSHAFLDDGIMHDLGTFPGGTQSAAYGINARGQVVGEANTANSDMHAFLYDASGMHDLGTFGGTWSVAYGINARGQVVGWASMASGGDTPHALLDDGTMHDLNDLVVNLPVGLTLDSASAINDRGQVAANGGGHAYLLTPLRQGMEGAKR